jgi:hypothetical protein
MNSYKSDKVGLFFCLHKGKRFFINIFYHLRYKYYQFENLIKYFPHGKGEVNRRKLIDSIDKLVNKTRAK